MTGVVAVFPLERLDEAGHLGRCDEALSFALPKPHDAGGGKGWSFATKPATFPQLYIFRTTSRIRLAA